MLRSNTEGLVLAMVMTVPYILAISIGSLSQGDSLLGLLLYSDPPGLQPRCNTFRVGYVTSVLPALVRTWGLDDSTVPRYREVLKVCGQPHNVLRSCKIRTT
jgi:hypothetical protein